MNNAYEIKLFDGGLLSKTHARECYQMHYSYKPISSGGKAEGQADTKGGIVIACISDNVLRNVWQIKGDDMEKVLHEFAKRHVIKLAKEGKLGGTSKCELKSDTAPKKCPFDSSRIQMEFDTWFPA